MLTQRIITVACLLGMLTVGPVFGADTRFDGHFWRGSDLQTRQLVVYSFVSGIVQGQDRVAQQLLKREADGFRPECHQAVSKNINRLEAELAQLNRALLMSTLDAFYKVKPNRKLALKWALLAVMQQLKGTVPPGTDRRIETRESESP